MAGTSYGYNRIFEVSQFRTGNGAENTMVLQQGVQRNVIGLAKQRGDANDTRIEQDGLGNVVGSSQQIGNGNAIRASFVGDENGRVDPPGVEINPVADPATFSSSVTSAVGLDQGNLYQSGDNNDMRLTVTGDNNLFAVAQWGDVNDARGTITGNLNELAVRQNGNANFAMATMTGDSNVAGISQLGNGNYSSVSQ